jgi:hypothetical protein
MSAFLKILPVKVLGGRFYLSEAHDPLPPQPVTHCMNTCTPVRVLIHTGREGGGGVDEQVSPVLG